LLPRLLLVQPSDLFVEIEALKGPVQRPLRLVAVLGILVALTGLLTPGDVGPLGLEGVLLGALGFFLGAHRLGPAAVVLSWVEILLGIMMS
jgi:hypothetical protein